MSEWSTIVIGGGPAGLSTALFLCAAAPELCGRVLVLEKEAYPREKFCAGAIGARADALLSTIGVEVDVPSVPISGIAVRAMGRTTIARERNAGRVVRRIEFDDALARAARARGIVVMDGVRATSLTLASDSVRVATSSGEFRAAALVAADGVNGFVRRALRIEASPHLAQALEVDTECLPSDLPRDLILFDATRRDLPGYYWDFPTIVGGVPMMCRGVYYLKTAAAESPVEIDDVLRSELEARGLDLSRYKKKRYAERGFHPSVVLSRPRVLFVGEAAGIDPVTGEGIAQAIGYGAVAGRYLAERIRARSFGFDDYADRIARSRVGRDVRRRERTLSLAYGPKRPLVERYVLDTPDFLRIGLQHFAGHRWSRRVAVRAALGAGRAFFRGF